MALKLIDQEEAARMLGVTPEQINSLRDQRKLFGYRDGEVWKFKQEDVERLRDEMKESSGDIPSDSSSGSWQGIGDLENVELEMNDELDSILLSEVELGDSAQSGPSTVIGKSNRAPGSDDDIQLAGSDSTKGKSPSDVPLVGGSGIIGGSGLGTLGSDVKLAGGSDVGQKAPGSSSDKLFGSDALSISDDELSIVDSAVPLIADSKVGKKGPSPGSSVKLDEESALSAADSDVTLRPGDSGIQLISAADSGISLEEPLALEGSAAGLLSDEDVISLDEGIEPESATQVKADDEFLLSAIDETTEDSDSGSQVIALDTDEELSSGIFAPVAGAGMLEEEPAASPLGAPLVASAPTLAAPGTGEAPFSGWNVAVLAVCAVFLLLCGMMVYDLLRNMWGWNQPYDVNSSIMDSLASSIGWMDK